MCLAVNATFRRTKYIKNTLNKTLLAGTTQILILRIKG